MDLRHSKESRNKISNKLKGKPKSEEHRKNLRLSHLGKKRSEEHKQNISRARIGIKSVTKEGKERLSKLRTGERNPNWKGGITPFYQQLRKQKLKENGGSHTLGEWETLKAQYNWTCFHCNKVEPDIILTKDHIIPVSKGGSDNIENIQPLCRKCNSKKWCTY